MPAMRPRIRLATASDAPALAAIYAPSVRTGPTSFELEPPSAEEMARRLARIAERFPWLVCEHAGAVFGYAYASQHRERPAYQWSVDVSVYVRDDARRAGVARALYTSLFAALALQGYRNAYAGVAMANTASIAFHEALGFTLVGIYHGVGYKQGAWHDVAWLERALAPRTSEPPPPTPITALHDAPALREALAVGAPLIRVDQLPSGAGGA